MDSELARHNKKILETEDDLLPPPRCNCQAALKAKCPLPLPGYCTVQCVVYRALVTEGDPSVPANQIIQTYTGLTEPPVKRRIKRHYSDIAKFNPNDPENHMFYVKVIYFWY